MSISEERIKLYKELLETELIPAMGCTEPIALAYAASKAREVLKEKPLKVEAFVSGNIVKNVKSVIVPNTNGAKGIPMAIAAGIVAGDPSKKLEVISKVSEKQIEEIHRFVEETPISVCQRDDKHIFDIGIKVYSSCHSAFVRIVDSHTNIVSIQYDNANQIVDVKNCLVGDTNNRKNEKLGEFVKTITIEEIVELASTCNTNLFKETLDRQIKYNMAIAEEGLNNNYGANIGKTLLASYGDDVFVKVKAYAAAGSDARMNGCELPVIINSGSGNQGITASVPVIVYGREKNISIDQIYRALLISNLSTIHIKTGIGKLSAYCGAVAAGCGSGAGICYLMGGDYKAIAHTLVNAMAITSGIVCDGAKASCAAKIASSVDAGLLGNFMYQNGNEFRGGDGIVKKGVENTISTVGELARVGMSETDKEIIKIMLD